VRKPNKPNAAEAETRPLEVVIVTNDFNRSEELMSHYADDARVAIQGIYRSYHADSMFKGPKEELPDIVVGNGKVKDRVAPYDEPVTVDYPTKRKAKRAGVIYVRELPSESDTKSALDRAIDSAHGKSKENTRRYFWQTKRAKPAQK
jgi:hypothetical protein